jgi:peptidoglycan/xylan/chitin deacetylase (PgdA/CDA1 family)
MKAVRRLLRSASYQSGGLSLVRRRQRHTLTVVMLHRVLDPGDPSFVHADPTYTLSLPLFEQLLGFLRDHYAIVSLRDVADAAAGARPLPSHAVLITFDDGWADNLRYAAPVLKSRGMPAVIFVVPDAIITPGNIWWQEQVFAAARSGALAATSAYARERLPFPLDMVAALAAMDPSQRQAILASVPMGPNHARMMLTPEEVPQLASFGIDVGLHGYSHAPLTAVDDVKHELRRARDAVAMLSAGTATTTALGCPHGRYDHRVLAGARAAGVKLTFTSDPVLNNTAGGMLATDTFGRINVEAGRISSQPHRFDPAGAARWLWSRDSR